jgi:diadenylate cyclase
VGDFLEVLRQSYLLDILDVVIVAFLFYRVYLILRGTRATEMFVGLAIMFGFSLVAQSLGLLLLNRIIVSLQTVWLIAFIIVFQPELRGALSYLGKTRTFRFFVRHEPPTVIEEILRAVQRISRSGLGAIIVIEQNTGLKNHIETGTEIRAHLSAALLETIFTPPTPLHDGAVIVNGNSIVAAGCILPLSRNEHLAYTLGTRHRAALGLSEESDAFVIVVSEENRQISIAEAGTLRRKLDVDTLRRQLGRVYGVSDDFDEMEIPAELAGAATGSKTSAQAKDTGPTPDER